MIYAIIIYRYKVNIAPLNKIKKERERPSIIKKGGRFHALMRSPTLRFPFPPTIPLRPSEHVLYAASAGVVFSASCLITDFRRPLSAPTPPVFRHTRTDCSFFLKCWRAHLSLPS